MADASGAGSLTRGVSGRALCHELEHNERNLSILVVVRARSPGRVTTQNGAPQWPRCGCPEPDPSHRLACRSGRHLKGSKMHARGEHDCFWYTGSLAVFLPQHSLSEIQRFGRLRFVHSFGFHIAIPLVSRGLDCRGISVILCSMDKTLAANKITRANAGGPCHLANPALWAARIAQLRRYA